MSGGRRPGGNGLWDHPSPRHGQRDKRDCSVCSAALLCGSLRDCGGGFFIEVPASQKNLVCVKLSENRPTQHR